MKQEKGKAWKGVLISVDFECASPANEPLLGLYGRPAVDVSYSSSYIMIIKDSEGDKTQFHFGSKIFQRLRSRRQDY